VSSDRIRQRHVARFTNDCWDNTVGVSRLDDSALGSLHGSRRITQLL
jgi:hypothetical protein